MRFECGSGASPSPGPVVFCMRMAIRCVVCVGSDCHIDHLRSCRGGARLAAIFTNFLTNFPPSIRQVSIRNPTQWLIYTGRRGPECRKVEKSGLIKSPDWLAL